MKDCNDDQTMERKRLMVRATEEDLFVLGAVFAGVLTINSRFGETYYKAVRHVKTPELVDLT